HHTLRMMGQAANARLTPEIAQEVCQRTSSVAALQGSIALIGSRYNLILKAVNCASGDLLATTEGQANDKNHVLDALGKAASEMRRRLGESLSTVQKYNTPLEQATTPSLEALQAYNSSLNAPDGPAAIALLQRAFGSAERAGQQANLAKRGSTGRDLDYGVALALAYAGDASQARALADDLGKRFPEDTIVQFNS